MLKVQCASAQFLGFVRAAPAMSKRAQPAASASSSSAPASHFVRYEREDDGSRKLAEHFVKFVAEQMLGGMDRAERLSFAPFQLGLDDSHVEVLENVGVIKRKDNTFLAERGDIFYVPAAERDRCARAGDAVRELEGRIELVWQEPAAVEERPHQAQRLVEKVRHAGRLPRAAPLLPPLSLLHGRRHRRNGRTWGGRADVLNP